MTDVVDDADAPARSRAKPMAPDERRAMIAAEAVPLFLEHGSALTTRQLAEHLGIAEGTIFRAFGDKESLVRAAVHAFFDQARERMDDGLVDPQLPLDEKVRRLVRGTQLWMQRVFRMLSLLPRDEIPQYFARDRDGEFRSVVAAIFAPDADRLNIPPERMSAVMRIAGIAANGARAGDGVGLTEDELVDFILYGIAGAARGEE
ncbi:MAG: TetR/AcrR family transcriptional regulator [Microbacterium sp.]|uniref:TetR/AcrR family transcriptional regulator n=1 Tax=Microbacterium sp. TaxID=51671 RepID=UPI0039E2F46D